MSSKIYLTNPKDAPFGKLSPLYDNLIPPISDKRVAIDKIGVTSSNLSCYVYAGLVKDRSIHQSLLEENPNRFVILPINYNDIWKMYKEQMACFWTAEEIDLAQDLKDWGKLNKNE